MGSLPRFGDIAPGQHLELKCQGCPKWFPWETSPNWYAEVPSYHNRKCRERRRISHQKATRYVKCPRIDKRLYRTHREAQLVAISLSKQYRQPFQVYTCVCGGRHVGRILYRKARTHG